MGQQLQSDNVLCPAATVRCYSSGLCTLCAGVPERSLPHFIWTMGPLCPFFHKFVLFWAFDFCLPWCFCSSFLMIKFCFSFCLFMPFHVVDVLIVFCCTYITVNVFYFWVTVSLVVVSLLCVVNKVVSGFFYNSVINSPADAFFSSAAFDGDLIFFVIFSLLKKQKSDQTVAKLSLRSKNATHSARDELPGNFSYVVAERGWGGGG